MMKAFSAALFLALLSACPGGAKTLPANPGNLKAVLAAAKGGDVVVLASGDYGKVAIPKANHSPAVTVDAKRARLRSLDVFDTAGWVWRGGTILGVPPPQQTNAVDIRRSHRIEIAGVTMTGTQNGAGIGRGNSDIVMRGNTVTGMISDGFQIAGSQRVSIIGNTCEDARPIPPIFDAAGKMVKDGTHADCVQFWSDAGHPTRDLIISGNRIRGKTNGITNFGPGTVERVTVENNDIEVDTWNGISLVGAKGTVVRNNRLRTIPGSLQIEPGPKGRRLTVKTWVRASDDAANCGNEVDGKKQRPC